MRGRWLAQTWLPAMRCLPRATLGEASQDVTPLKNRRAVLRRVGGCRFAYCHTLRRGNTAAMNALAPRIEQEPRLLHDSAPITHNIACATLQSGGHCRECVYGI